MVVGCWEDTEIINFTSIFLGFLVYWPTLRSTTLAATFQDRFLWVGFRGLSNPGTVLDFSWILGAWIGFSGMLELTFLGLRAGCEARCRIGALCSLVGDSGLRESEGLSTNLGNGTVFGEGEESPANFRAGVGEVEELLALGFFGASKLSNNSDEKCSSSCG